MTQVTFYTEKRISLEVVLIISDYYLPEKLLVSIIENAIVGSSIKGD